MDYDVIISNHPSIPVGTIFRGFVYEDPTQPARWRWGFRIEYFDEVTDSWIDENSTPDAYWASCHRFQRTKAKAYQECVNKLKRRVITREYVRLPI